MEKSTRSAKPVFYNMRDFMQKMESTDESVESMEKENWQIDWGSKPNEEEESKYCLEEAIEEDMEVCQSIADSTKRYSMLRSSKREKNFGKSNNEERYGENLAFNENKREDERLAA